MRPVCRCVPRLSVQPDLVCALQLAITLADATAEAEASPRLPTMEPLAVGEARACKLLRGFGHKKGFAVHGHGP
jgi:hypothetical protein